LIHKIAVRVLKNRIPANRENFYLHDSLLQNKSNIFYHNSFNITKPEEKNLQKKFREGQ